jgi:hypothetical protein
MRFTYMAALYQDRKTGRVRWGVVNSETMEWYFPKANGQDKSRKLATRMNKQAERKTCTVVEKKLKKSS